VTRQAWASSLVAELAEPFWPAASKTFASTKRSELQQPAEGEGVSPSACVLCKNLCKQKCVVFSSSKIWSRFVAIGRSGIFIAAIFKYIPTVIT